MTALNHAMNTKPVEYIFNKTLFKTFVIGNSESSIMIDQPFGSCIPEKLTMLLVDMRSMAGDPTLNPLYFKHCDLANTHVTIKGSTIYNINTDFNNDNYVHMFYECQKSIGIESNNMIELIHSPKEEVYSVLTLLMKLLKTLSLLKGQPI